MHLRRPISHLPHKSADQLLTIKTAPEADLKSVYDAEKPSDAYYNEHLYPTYNVKDQKALANDDSLKHMVKDIVKQHMVKGASQKHMVKEIAKRRLAKDVNHKHFREYV